MNGPSFLVKAGWKSTTVKSGDAVTVTVNPLRTEEKVGKFVSITLPDGRTLTERPLSAKIYGRLPDHVPGRNQYVNLSNPDYKFV
jgi:hypothetical protein